jgi:hypothetical protein
MLFKSWKEFTIQLFISITWLSVYMYMFVYVTLYCVLIAIFYLKTKHILYVACIVNFRILIVKIGIRKVLLCMCHQGHIT